MNKKQISIISFITLGLLLALSFGWVAAQEPEPLRGPQALEALDVSSKYIPIQGRLTDAGGAPLSGIYQVSFRIYSQSSGGTPLCEATKSVMVSDGLFSTYFDGTGCSIDGRQLYLGVKVEDDPEMTPRQYIDTVPIAWTLRPGATISATLPGGANLHIENWGTSGRGLRSYAMAESSTNFGIVGASRSPDGYGGYFYNNGGGVGLYASTDAASGVGIIAKGVDSGPDLILGSNADTGVGDDGIITSDPDLLNSDIIIKSNDVVRIDLDNDGSGEDASFEIRDKDNVLIFDVDESGVVIQGGAGIAAFPRPAYDSGWRTITAGDTLVLNHNLGDSVDNYVVDLTFKHGSYGNHAFGWGGDVTSGGFYGAFWRNLTSTSITVERATNDSDCPEVRIRIWMYP